MANAHWLGSIWQIRLEPREYRTIDAKTGTKTVDEGDVIDGVAALRSKDTSKVEEPMSDAR